jgi:hypothetical protein
VKEGLCGRWSHETGNKEWGKGDRERGNVNKRMNIEAVVLWRFISVRISGPWIVGGCPWKWSFLHSCYLWATKAPVASETS